MSKDRRRLTSILAADVVGYSRLVAADESGTVRALRACRAMIDPLIARHGGRIFGSAGDSVLAEFGSVVDALAAAVDLQLVMRLGQAERPETQRIVYRIGVAVGDVMVEGDNLLGDGVNIAARLEGLAEPGGIVIAGNVREQVEGKLKLDFDDLGEQALKNIPRPVRAHRVRFAAEAMSSVALAASGRASPRHRATPWAALGAGAALLAAFGVFWWAPWSDAPSSLPLAATVAARPAAPAETAGESAGIAVLAFTNSTGDPEQEYFSDGISDDILTGLTRFSGLKVIARNSSFRYKGQNVDIKQVGRELGVGYVLEGSVRRDGDKIRVTAQLIETGTGAHLWAERYDRPFKEIFAVQDEITQRVVSSLVAYVGQAERKVVAAKGPEKLDAYDLTLQGREFKLKGGKENAIKGRQALERATEIDPNYAPTVSRLADSYNSFLINRYNEEWATPELADKMLATAARAVALDPGNAYAHAVFGSALTQVGRHDEAVTELERALRLNSNDVDVLQIAGAILFRSGFPEKSVEIGAKRIELDPFQSPSGFPTYAKALFLAKNYEQAMVMTRRCEPTNTSCILTRIAAAGRLGQAEAGKTAVAEMLKLQPNYTVRDEIKAMEARWRRQQDIDHFADGLRKAGLPE